MAINRQNLKALVANYAEETHAVERFHPAHVLIDIIRFNGRPPTDAEEILKGRAARRYRPQVAINAARALLQYMEPRLSVIDATVIPDNPAGQSDEAKAFLLRLVGTAEEGERTIRNKDRRRNRSGSRDRLALTCQSGN